MLVVRLPEFRQYDFRQPEFRRLARVHCAFTSVTCRLERVTEISVRTFGLDQNVIGLSSRVQIISLIIIKQIKSIWAQSEILASRIEKSLSTT
jgi:hypothetical protein